MTKYKCKICGKICGDKGFSSHLNRKHKISAKDYYDKYLKKPGEGICVVCGKNTEFLGFKGGYRLHCSIQCSTNDPKVIEKSKKTINQHFGKEGLKHPSIKQKKIETSRQRYGTDNPAQSEKVKDKIKQTNNDKYGHDYYYQSMEFKEKSKQTCLDKYGVEYHSQSEEGRLSRSKSMKSSGIHKQKETNIKHFGIEYASQVDKIKEKKKKSYLSKYGVDNPAKSEEIKQQKIKTCNKRYGVDNVLQINWIKEKRNSPEAKEKRKQTNLARWGVDNPIKNQKIQRKRLNTLKKNGTFSTSSLEEYFVERCLKDNIEIKTQGETNDKRYPYAYDFYLPEKDLFVEINGTWTHGSHWFNKNNKNDLKLISFWKTKSKNSDYYKGAIQNWTIKDVEKRETARRNELNYVVLWNKQDIEEWFSLGCPIGQDWKKEYTWKK